MFGVEVAIATVTCAAVIILLLTAPWWMRLVTAFTSALGKQVAQTDHEVVIGDAPTDVVDGEFREVDK